MKTTYKRAVPAAACGLARARRGAFGLACAAGAALGLACAVAAAGASNPARAPSLEEARDPSLEEARDPSLEEARDGRKAYPGLRLQDGVLVPDPRPRPGERPATGLEKPFPEPVVPEDNPTTPEKVELGRLLFFDPVLSGDNTLSCAHCHHPDLGFSDGLPRSRGAGARGVGPNRKGGVELARAAPSLWNALYNKAQFWDGRAPTLEEQARGPITSPVEMAEGPERLVTELEGIPEYRALFDRAFGGREGSGVTFANVLRAVAAFERTLVSFDSPYDRYAAGDTSALDAAARRGLKLFLSTKTRCSECHEPPLFGGRHFKVIGVPDPPGGPPDTRHPDAPPGRGGGPQGAYKVPILRNVALTAPYMHNGIFATLEEVIDFYAAGGGRGLGLDVPLQDDKVRPFPLTPEERSDLVAFLRALTDVSALPAVPDRVPSGLPVVPRLGGARPAPRAPPRRGHESPPHGPITVRPGERIQDALERGGRGSEVRVEPGRYEEALLSIHHDVRLIGLERDGKRPVLAGGGRLADAVVALGDGFTMEGFEIEHYQGNGAVVHGARGVRLRNLLVRDPGLYGVYPVGCEDVLVEDCKVSGARDAGIYVGQSRSIVVRRNEVFQNVAGIEIENSVSAEVYDNYVHGNTGGILVFLLPFNPSKEARGTKVYRNRVIGNNTANFADPGAIVSNVLRGTGILVLAADETEIFDNVIAENGSYGVAVSGLGALFPEGTPFDVDPDPDRNVVRGNTYRLNGRDPDPRLRARYALPPRDILWDGTGSGNRFAERGASSYPERLPGFEEGAGDG